MHGMKEVKRVPLARALRAGTTHEHDYVEPYVKDLDNIIDMKAIASAGLKIGIDPMGGAGVYYWDPIAEEYGLDIQIVNKYVDPTFSFMTVDKDGKIRMDCSSPYAMAGLIGLKDKFNITFKSQHGLFCILGIERQLPLVKTFDT